MISSVVGARVERAQWKSAPPMDLALVQLAVLVLTAHLWVPTLTVIVRELWTAANRQDVASSMAVRAEPARRAGALGARGTLTARWSNEGTSFHAGRVRNSAWQLGRADRPAPARDRFARRDRRHRGTRGTRGNDPKRHWEGGFGQRGV